MKIKSAERKLCNWVRECVLHKEKIPFFIAGGAICSLIKNEVVRDYDLYFYNQKDIARASNILKGAYGEPLSSTPAADSFGKIQIIKAWVGSPFEIINGFDFAHSQGFYEPKNGVFVSQESLVSIAENSLHYFTSEYPLASLFRVRKFVKRGWDITAGELLKIAFEINKLDLEDVDVLREQLVGVDLLLFQELLSKLDNNKKIDQSYLFPLIEEIF